MSDIKDPRLLYFKGALFLAAGCVAAGLIVAQQPTLRVALLLAIAIWAFCRAYYFAFYVIEHYMDSSYKFAGLGSLAVYLWRKRLQARSSRSQDVEEHTDYR